jgi:hypothetical protein
MWSAIRSIEVYSNSMSFGGRPGLMVQDALRAPHHEV